MGQPVIDDELWIRFEPLQPVRKPRRKKNPGRLPEAVREAAIRVVRLDATGFCTLPSVQRSRSPRRCLTRLSRTGNTGAVSFGQWNAARTRRSISNAGPAVDRSQTCPVLSARLQPQAQQDRDRNEAIQISMATLRHLDQGNHRCGSCRPTGRRWHQNSNQFLVNIYRAFAYQSVSSLYPRINDPTPPCLKRIVKTGGETLDERYDMARPRHMSDFVIKPPYCHNPLASETELLT